MRGQVTRACVGLIVCCRFLVCCPALLLSVLVVLSNCFVFTLLHSYLPFSARSVKVTCLTTFGFQTAIGHGESYNTSSLTIDQKGRIKDFVQALKQKDKEKEVVRAKRNPVSRSFVASTQPAAPKPGKPFTPTLGSFSDDLAAAVARSVAAMGSLQKNTTSAVTLPTFTMESFKDLHEMAKLDNDVGFVVSAVSVADAVALARERQKARKNFALVSGGFAPLEEGAPLVEGESEDALAESSSDLSSPRLRRSLAIEKWQRSLALMATETISEEEETNAEDKKAQAIRRTKSLFIKEAAAIVAARDGARFAGGKTPTEYALKMFNKAKIISTNKVAQVLNEAAILAISAVQQCPFIVRRVGKFQTSDFLVLVMEKAARRDLWTLMNDRRGGLEGVRHCDCVCLLVGGFVGFCSTTSHFMAVHGFLFT